MQRIIFLVLIKIFLYKPAVNVFSRFKITTSHERRSFLMSVQTFLRQISDPRFKLYLVIVFQNGGKQKA